MLQNFLGAQREDLTVPPETWLGMGHSFAHLDQHFYVLSPKINRRTLENIVLTGSSSLEEQNR